jgi:hypothetical protein
MEGRSRLQCWGLWLLEEYGMTRGARGIRTEFGGGQVMADLLDRRDSAVPAVENVVSLHSPISSLKQALFVFCVLHPLLQGLWSSTHILKFPPTKNLRPMFAVLALNEGQREDRGE